MPIEKLQYKYFCTTLSTDVLFDMKIFSSSPYATFNPKEWDSLSRANFKFSDTPIKIKNKSSCNYKSLKSAKILQKNNELFKHIQLALI